MSVVTLTHAQRLRAAGLPVHQAVAIAAAVEPAVPQGAATKRSHDQLFVRTLSAQTALTG